MNKDKNNKYIFILGRYSLKEYTQHPKGNKNKIRKIFCGTRMNPMRPTEQSNTRKKLDFLSLQNSRTMNGKIRYIKNSTDIDQATPLGVPNGPQRALIFVKG